jgi:photosystem I P700 chlorophyll a apoprotein A1
VLKLFVVGQEILNGDVGGGLVFKLLGSSQYGAKWYYKRTSTLLNCDWRFSNGSSYVLLVGSTTTSAPKLEWFQNVESMLNHHFWSMGLGSLAWAGHQIHVSLPINKLLDAGVDPKNSTSP